MAAEVDHALPDGSYVNELGTATSTLDHASPSGSYLEEFASTSGSSAILPFVWVAT